MKFVTTLQGEVGKKRSVAVMAYLTACVQGSPHALG